MWKIHTNQPNKQFSIIRWGLILFLPLYWGCGTTTMGLLEDDQLQGVDWVEVSFIGPVDLSYHTESPVIWHENKTVGTIHLAPEGPLSQLEFQMDHYNNGMPVCIFLVPSWGGEGQPDTILAYGGPNPNGVKDDGTEMPNWTQSVQYYRDEVDIQAIYWPTHGEATNLSGAGYSPLDPPLKTIGKLGAIKILRSGRDEANYSAEDVKAAIEIGPKTDPSALRGPMKNSHICANPGQYISFRIKSVSPPPAVATNAGPDGVVGTADDIPSVGDVGEGTGSTLPGGPSTGITGAAPAEPEGGGAGCPLQLAAHSSAPSTAWVWLAGLALCLARWVFDRRKALDHR